MAITPKKKTQNPLSSPGGGVKGGSMGTGGVAKGIGGGVKKAVGPRKVTKSGAKKAYLTEPEKAAQKAKLQAAAERKAASTPSVKVVGARGAEAQANFNKASTTNAQNAKSGSTARSMMKFGEAVFGKGPAVKVNSAVKAAKPSAATVKATKKALKKINK